MSASQEKKNRSVLRSEGTDRKAKAAAEQAGKDRKFRRNAILFVVIAVVVIAAALFINSNVLYTGTTAVKIGDVRYSPAEVSCYYKMSYNALYNSLYSSYGELASYILNPNTPLKDQQYSETQSWADYLYEQTLDNMQQVTALCREAEKNGFALSEEEQQSVEASVSQMRAYALSGGYPDLDSFLVANYGGKGMSEKVFRKVSTQMALADAYAAHVQEGFTYTGAQLEDYYSANADDLDYFNYYLYFISSSNDRYADLADDAAKLAKAHEDAAELTAAADLEDFLARVREFSESDSDLTLTVVQGSGLSDDYSGWLRDSTLAEGDKTVIDTETGSYALWFVGREDNNYPMVNMRHVLFMGAKDEDGAYTAESLDEAELRARDVLVQYRSDPTEEHFASLANELSEDEGSNTNGGLYENVIRHQMVDGVNDFLFNEGSRPGDTAVVYGENEAYQGYHAVLYVSDGELVRTKLAENALIRNDYEAYISARLAECPVSVGSGMKLATVE